MLSGLCGLPSSAALFGIFKMIAPLGLSALQSLQAPSRPPPQARSQPPPWQARSQPSPSQARSQPPRQKVQRPLSQARSRPPRHSHARARRASVAPRPARFARGARRRFV